MQLYLDTFGASLRVKNKMFWVKPSRSDGRLIPVREVNSIFLTKGIHVSTDALLLAIRHNIPVLLIDGLGRMVGQVWDGQYGSIATIRKQQALLANNEQGLLWVRDLLVLKLERQRGLLSKWLEISKGGNRDKLDGGIRVIYNMEQKLRQFSGGLVDKKAAEASFRGWEGTASRHYFVALSELLPLKYQFKNRTKRPAYDAFNALLNYMYAILYAQVHLSLMKAGLDPYMGIFHADQHRKPTLVYDVIEIYRYWIEEVALRLCCEDKLPNDAFVMPDAKTGIWLNRSAKPIVVNTCLSFLNEKVVYQGHLRKRLTHIDLDAQRWATQIRSFEF
jgi:CRISPR-associated protein Cas1